MKIYLFVIAGVLCVLASMPAASNAANIYYAQIIDAETYIYKDHGKSIICELPTTYFACISSYNNGYYKADYNGTKGYIKANRVKVIKGVPQKPYLTDATFRLFASDYSELKASPSALSRTYTTLPTNQSITYIGKAYGDELIENRGKIWYYCKWENNTETICGYVYSGLCDSLNITYNTEVVQYISNPFLTTSSYYKQYLNSPSGKNLILSCVLLVSVCFLPLLILPQYFATHKKRKQKPSPMISIEDGKV